MSRVRRRRYRKHLAAVEVLEALAAERVLSDVRAEVVRRHARPRPTRPGWVECTLSRAEMEGHRPRRVTSGTDGKVLFDTREAAEACARELEALAGNPQRAYHWPRRRAGHAGHWHLTTDGTRSRAEKEARRERLSELRAAVQCHQGQAS